MDVAKYIGLFLLKNGQCYVHGLGTMQLVRKPASYDGQALQPSSYEILMAPGGNVDEALSNFIANNEQISISKASNALKEFSTQTRTTIQQGGEVALNHLGTFIQQDGRIGFATNPHMLYKPTPIPAHKGSSLQHQERPQFADQGARTSTGFVLPKAPPPGHSAPAMAAPPPMEERYQDEEEEKGGISWLRILLFVFILGLMAVGVYFGYKYYLVPKLNKPAPRQMELPTESNMPIPEVDDFDEPAVHSEDTSTTQTGMEQQEMNTPAPTETTPATEPVPAQPVETTATGPAPKTVKLKVVINTYDSRARAEKRKRQLNAYGTSVQVLEEDTNYFFIIMPVQTTTTDTARILDSLSRTYNPEGVFKY